MNLHLYLSNNATITDVRSADEKIFVLKYKQYGLQEGMRNKHTQSTKKSEVQNNLVFFVFFAETTISVHKMVQLICYIVHAKVCSQSLYYPVPNILHSMNTSLFQTLLILSCL